MSQTQTSLYRSRPKFDPIIIEKLMTYVERTLDKKLSSISNLIKKNKKNLQTQKKKYYEAERKVMEYKRSKTGSNLLTDDIKFFFNLVKAQPPNQVIDGLEIKDGRPSPRFGKPLKRDATPKSNRRSVSQKARSRMGSQIGRKKRGIRESRKSWKYGKERTRSRGRVEEKEEKELKRKKIPVKNSDRCIVKPLRKRGVSKGRRSISRPKEREEMKRPMKRWEMLYQMAHNDGKEKEGEMESGEEEVEKPEFLRRCSLKNGRSLMKEIESGYKGETSRRSMESTKKKGPNSQRYLDEEESPDKKLWKQRTLKRSKRAKRRKNHHEEMIKYTESSDSSDYDFVQNSPVQIKYNSKQFSKIEEIPNYPKRKEHPNLRKSACLPTLNMKVEELSKTATAMGFKKPRRSRNRRTLTISNLGQKFKEHNIHQTQDQNPTSSSEFTNLDNYQTDRPNQKSPIRLKRDQHPLDLFRHNFETKPKDSEINNTERLIEKEISVESDLEDSFSKDRMGRRLIDGMVEVGEGLAEIMEEKSIRVERNQGRGEDDSSIWKEIEEERIKVVKMLESVMQSTDRTQAADFSSAENIFKHYESNLKGDEKVRTFLTF